MPFIAGVDGCRSGWITLTLDTDTRRIGSKIFRTAADLLHHLGDLSLIAIDIPIGLSDADPRICDRAARKRLGPKRGCSVFPAPIRPLIETLRISRNDRRSPLGHESAAGVTPALSENREQGTETRFTYRHACSLNESITGRKISKQAWQIFPKILEIDDLFAGDPSLRNRLIEVHPEVTFAAWAGEPILEPKKKSPGFIRRRALIDSHFGPAAYAAVRSRYLVKHVAHDDILDAFAALWTAERALNGNAQRLPDSPPRDSRGLPMQIVY